jgi:phosphopantetheinyl transferase
MNEINSTPEIELAANRVDIYYSQWRRSAELPSQEELQILSQTERDCLARLRKLEDRVSYAKAHLMLRQTLRKYVRESAANLEFTTSTTGKPELILALDLPSIEFNLTHCETMVACAVSRTPVGIDVEPYHRVLETETIQHLLHPDEWLLLQHLDGCKQSPMAIQFWTCKEAALKALGLGLSIEPNHVLINFMNEREVFANILAANGETKQLVRLYPNLIPDTAHSLTVACICNSIQDIRIFALD